jgi:uncharacterized protein YbaR (Trm112 family)
MHILMTDVLTCPRCGPQYGLILLADEVRERRVLTGRLGCANCREKYEVRAGTVHFPAAGAVAPADAAGHAGTEAEAAAGQDAAAAADPEAAVRLAALMGLQQGAGPVLLAGTAAAQAGGVAELVPGLEVAAVNAPVWDMARGEPGASEPGPSEPAAIEPGVSHIRVSGSVLPFASDRMAGVALGGAAADTYLEEGARCLGPLGRLVLQPAPAQATGRLEAAGLRVVAAEGDTVVAARSRV